MAIKIIEQPCPISGAAGIVENKCTSCHRQGFATFCFSKEHGKCLTCISKEYEQLLHQQHSNKQEEGSDKDEEIKRQQVIIQGLLDEQAKSELSQQEMQAQLQKYLTLYQGLLDQLDQNQSSSQPPTTPFVFGSERAHNLRELAFLSLKHWELAKKELFGKKIEAWELFDKSPHLRSQIQKVRQLETDRDTAVYQFLLTTGYLMISLSEIAQGGKPMARLQEEIGLRYLEGHGFPKNPAEASKWLERSARLNNANAQYKLGMMYYEGKGVAKDDKLATKWFQLASIQSHKKADDMLHSVFLGKGIQTGIDFIGKLFSKD